MIAYKITKARKDKKPIQHKKELPKLSVMSLDIVANNFNLYPDLKNLEQAYKYKVYDKISLDHPLEMVVPRINYENYWNRACKKNYKSAEYAYHGNSWKQCFAENFIKELVSNYENDKQDVEVINKYLELFQYYIFNLKIPTFSADFDISKIPLYFVNLSTLELKYSPKLKEDKAMNIFKKQLTRIIMYLNNSDKGRI